MTASMSCFSPPCGYLTFMGITSIPGTVEAAWVRASMASGLLFSIAMTPRLTPAAFIRRLTPLTISRGFSRMSMSSQERQGSHSAALMITTSAFDPGGGDSFTWQGKVAPPRPTMPAFLMMSMMALPSSAAISASLRAGVSRCSSAFASASRSASSLLI